MESLNKEERQKRILFLRRQEERKRNLPRLLSSLSNIAGRQITETDVLSLDKIDSHNISLNCTDFDFNYLNLSFPKDKITELKTSLQLLARYLDNNSYLTLSKYSDIAVINGRTNFIIDNLVSLIDLDGYTFTICDLNYENGFCISFYSVYGYVDGKAELRPIYEFRVFGQEWIKKIAALM